jgi:hypothetical protein
MMLKVYKQNLTFFIHVLYVHKVVSQIKMETFQDFKIEHDWDKDVASKGSLGHQEAQIYHQKSKGVVHKQQLTASHRERCSRVETIPMKSRWPCFTWIFGFLLWWFLLALEPCLCGCGLFYLGFGHLLAKCPSCLQLYQMRGGSALGLEACWRGFLPLWSLCLP